MILLCYSLAAAIGGGLYEHIVLLDHTTHDRSTPSTILDSGACGDHAVHHLIVDDDVE